MNGKCTWNSSSCSVSSKHWDHYVVTLSLHENSAHRTMKNISVFFFYISVTFFGDIFLVSKYFNLKVLNKILISHLLCIFSFYFSLFFSILILVFFFCTFPQKFCVIWGEMFIHLGGEGSPVLHHCFIQFNLSSTQERVVWRSDETLYLC